MEFSTASSPFSSPHNSVHRVMHEVLIALIPTIGLMFWLFGYTLIIQLVLACSSALLAEACLLRLRHRAIRLYLFDGSALLTAVLLALAIPSLAPWWIIVSGTVFAIIIAKQLYGGLGYNPFNPAMAGYAFLLISFPLQMSTWQDSQIFLSFSDAFKLIINEKIPFDSLSSATLLDSLRTQLSLGKVLNLPPLFIDPSTYYLSLAYLIGGLYLYIRKTITWHIPLALIVGLTLPASIMYCYDAQRYNPAILHLFSGATFCAAFFIATDPVTAAASNKGRLIYGLLIGSLLYIIRTWGAYPDGVAFAVLLANLCAPSIDYYTRPKAIKPNE